MQHDGSGRIVVQHLSKNFGAVQAVSNLSFTVEPGSVTGFIGPNGAGKTTTLRMILGLVRPTQGTATINGLPHDKLGNPATVVGSVLENEGFHPKRTARNHLRVYAAAIGVPDTRVDEVLSLVGLTDAANRKAGGFSLGMRQRLALAAALLGDPQVLVLDEPANGLDPEGIAWLRQFLRNLAREGRTVLVSSHLLAELEQTIDQVVIVSRGQTVYYGKLDDLRKQQQSRILVQAADGQALVTALKEQGVTRVETIEDGRLAVYDSTVQQVGDIAAKAGVALYGVQEETADLEQLFFQLTRSQYAGQQPAQPFAGPQAQQGQWGPPQQPGMPPQQPGQQWAPQGQPQGQPQQWQQPPQPGQQQWQGAPQWQQPPAGQPPQQPPAGQPPQQQPQQWQQGQQGQQPNPWAGGPPGQGQQPGDSGNSGGQG
ncbi:ATP-binding cassette domain-containing protein [Thermocrispum municipale]|uniref:ATP-binding cassette domain-containing protein n=1 Tax=Thermocrispum municipale TaxID=37926 RepID=UPI000414A6A6|nr:ATP-binding cassette domain-containing protein [Thermocrispum municipale]